jgi:DNA invertase Pin-like site-specific DNA recombinase
VGIKTEAEMTKAFSYLRTSSAANVGHDKDSDTRQRLAIQAYADTHDIEIAGEFYDANVKGAEPVHARPGFAKMLAAIAGNGVRTVLVETASRFARDLIIQETGYAYLRDLGVTLVAVDDPDAFTEDTPTSVMIRQILGAVAQFEKASLVAKLKGARDRKRATTGRCEGRKPAPEAARELANKLRGDGLSFRMIATKLAAQGFLAPSGKAYGPASIVAMMR